MMMMALHTTCKPFRFVVVVVVCRSFLCYVHAAHTHTHTHTHTDQSKNSFFSLLDDVAELQVGQETFHKTKICTENKLWLYVVLFCVSERSVLVPQQQQQQQQQASNTQPKLFPCWSHVFVGLWLLVI